MYYHLQTAFADALGIRTPRQRHDPVHFALSLDAPVSADNPDGDTLGDTVPDTRDPYQDAEARMWLSELSKALTAALDSLPADQREVIVKRYYFNDTIAAIADDTGTTWNAVQQKERRALRTIRNSRHRRQLEPFRETMNEIERVIDGRTDFFLHVGVETFSRDRFSAVERLTIQRDEMRTGMTRNLSTAGQNPPPPL